MNIAIILSAGSGTRMKEKKPKQFLTIKGKEILNYSLDTFYHHHLIDAIVLVGREEDSFKYNLLIGALNKKSIYFVVGGKSRSESSYRALSFLKTIYKDDDVVLIHDAARPLVSKRIITENIEKVSKGRSVLTYLPMTDSAFLMKDERFEKSLTRDALGIAQTPQSFMLNDIYSAYKRVDFNNSSFTDDIQVFKCLFDDVELVKGDKLNLKITTQEDLRLVNSILSND